MSQTISIIIPVYNGEKYLRRCFDSILNQTYKNLEIICIDDHSTDSSVKIIKEYSERDSRIVALNDPGKGAADARNFGIDNAHGDYIGFVDADDFIQPQMYEFLYRAIKENDCKIAVCEYEKTKIQEVKMFDYICRDYAMEEFTGDKDHWGKDEMVMSGVWTKLAEADFLKKNARFENYKIGEDTLFCAQLWAANGKSKAAFVDLPLYGYFVNDESVTHFIDEKRNLFLIQTRRLAYGLYREAFEKTAEYFLIKCFLLIVKCKSENLFRQKENNIALRKMFIKTIIPFLKNRQMSFKEKIAYIRIYLRGK